MLLSNMTKWNMPKSKRKMKSVVYSEQAKITTCLKLNALNNDSAYWYHAIIANGTVQMIPPVVRRIYYLVCLVTGVAYHRAGDTCCNDIL